MFVAPHVIPDLLKTIIMFIGALIGLRWTLVDMFAIDIFNFQSPLTKIIWGIAILIVFTSVVKVLIDPKEARKLGQAITGREFKQKQIEALKANKKQYDENVKSLTEEGSYMIPSASQRLAIGK